MHTRYNVVLSRWYVVLGISGKLWEFDEVYVSGVRIFMKVICIHCNIQNHLKFVIAVEQFSREKILHF